MDQMQNKLVFQVREKRPQSEVQTKVEEAWQAYEQSVQKHEKEEITQMKLYIFYIRSVVAQLHDYVDVTKEMLRSIGEISKEVDGLFEIDIDPQSDRFSIGIEKYPRFMREFIKRRRAKRYYEDKMRDTLTKIRITMIRVGFASQLAQNMVNSMGKMMKGFSRTFNFSTGKKKKKGGISIPADIAADFERRKAASPVFGGTGSAEVAPKTGADDGSDGGAAGGTTGGDTPAGGGSGSGDIAGDHWGDDIM